MFATSVPLAIAATVVAALLVATAAVFPFVTTFVVAAFFTATFAAFSLRVGVEGFVVLGDFFTLASFVVTEKIKEGAGDVGRCVASV